MFKPAVASLALAALLVPATAAAQPAVTAPTAAPAPMPLATVPPPADAPDLYNPDVALGLSLGITAAGYGSFVLLSEMNDNDAGQAVALAGVLAVGFGPSVGHWYQGDIWTRGLATRLAGTAAFIYGLSTVELFCDDCDDSDDALGAAMMLGGMAAFGIGTIDDIISAPFAAKRRNREHRASMQLTLAPQVSGNQAGFVLGGRF